MKAFIGPEWNIQVLDRAVVVDDDVSDHGAAYYAMTAAFVPNA